MEWIIVVGLLTAMWFTASGPVEKIKKQLQDKGILKKDYEEE